MNPHDYEAWRTGVGKGWQKLMDEMVNDITKMGWDGTVLQIKEKFGGLRFYIGAASDAIHNRIHEAEEASYKLCEECGQPGQLRSGGWLKTLCDKHANGRKVWTFKEDIP